MTYYNGIQLVFLDLSWVVYANFPKLLRNRTEPDEQVLGGGG